MPILERTGLRALSVESGEIISVLGAPASGKTRLALELAFLEKPLEGAVLFHGKDPMQGKRSSSRRPRAVTMLVQNAEDQLFARTAFDDVAFGPRHLGLTEREIEERVMSSLAAVRLDPQEVRLRSPFALSGGERRRVALAGVLAMQPEVLILDEPTSNLDPHTRSVFAELLQPLRRRGSVIWMTSNAAEAAQADRSYLLRNGKTVEVASGEDLLLNWRELAGAGIDLPAVYALASEIESRGCTLPETSSAHELRDAIVTLGRRSGR
ncbi:MAG: ATP-binding cassette domain-containing protein [Chloroflexota bacterium]